MQDTISLMVYPSEESFINQFVAPKMVVIPLYLASTMWLTHSQCGGDPFTINNRRDANLSTCGIRLVHISGG